MTPRPGGEPSFLYLNRDGGWEGFHVDGLDIGSDGALRLRSLPLLASPLPEGLRTAPTPSAPAGIAVGSDGTVYLTVPDDGAGRDPMADLVLRVDGCDGSRAPVPCLGGAGREPTRFRRPRGLLIDQSLRQMLVADSDNHRVQGFHLDDWQLAGILDESQGLLTPWVLAGDGAGNLYVLDHGRREVLRFSLLDGRSVPFWETVAGRQPRPTDPIDLAIGGGGLETEVHILDGASRSIFVYDQAGRYVRSFGGDVLQQPLGLAATAGAIYVGDNARRRVLAFLPDGTFAGEASGYRGPIAALAVDPNGGLLVHPGSTIPPLRFSMTGAYSREGMAWAGPYSNPGRIPQEWHLIAADAEIPADSHLQLFIYASTSVNDPPDPTSEPPWAAGIIDLAASLADGSLADRRWLRLPLDASHAVVHALVRPPLGAALDVPGASSPADRLSWLWVGVRLTSEGLSSASLAQIRIDFDHPTDLDYLPAIYREHRASSEFVGRYLSLMESAFTDVEERIGGLPARFDAEAVPADLLTWLAEWLALDVERTWSEVELRAAIRGAFEAYGKRGTLAGLRETVRRYARVDVRIEEPLLNASWWSLAAEGATAPDADMSNLDFTTMLAPAEVQGAVLGTTAVLDGAYLLEAEEFGLPLFSDIAHRFVASIYRGAGYSQERLSEVRAVIDREKPAHTLYELCVIEPKMRIGFQARLGIDTLISGAIQPTFLEESTQMAGFVLGGEPPGTLGEQSAVGRSTRLAAG